MDDELDQVVEDDLAERDGFGQECVHLVHEVNGDGDERENQHREEKRLEVFFEDVFVQDSENHLTGVG